MTVFGSRLGLNILRFTAIFLSVVLYIEQDCNLQMRAVLEGILACFFVFEMGNGARKIFRDINRRLSNGHRGKKY